MDKLIFGFITLIILFHLREVGSSVGDNYPLHQKCVQQCFKRDCNKADEEPWYLTFLQWNCWEECQYHCMWKTVDDFHRKGWATPQFFGKWPFLRLFGIQEPASVFFSFLNLAAHIQGIRKFRKSVPSDAPFYWLWHFFCTVCVNAWVWSMVFHARDKPLTEFLDYASAFSIVLVSCYCMLIRIFRSIMSRFFLVVLTVFILSCFINHVLYLSMGYFDYSYNMKVNILTGSLTAIGWFIWATYNRIRQPYVWKCALFLTFTAMVTLLELMDSPPLFWVFDWHAWWHLTTAPLTLLFYSFLIDDCNYLKKTAEKIN